MPNPAHEEENFADKWNEYPERRAAFVQWHNDLSTLLDDLAQLQGKGLNAVALRLSESFTPAAVQRSVQRYGERLRHQTATGAHRMGVGGLLTTTTATGPRVRPHTFYGQHPHPRG